MSGTLVRVHPSVPASQGEDSVMSYGRSDWLLSGPIPSRFFSPNAL